VIDVQNLSKTFKVHERPPGLGAAFKSLFSRTYKEVKAVNNLSFKIADGERVGFLGPNGAGKTTSLKMLSGLLHPSSGTIQVDGFTPKERQAQYLERITLVMGQKQQLLWDLPPLETFHMNRAVYDIPQAQFAESLKLLVDLLGVDGLIRKPTRQLSLGERMKCELVAALLHRPKVLFLDEPTIGLDVSMQATVREFIRDYNDKTGATVLLTTHYMEDVTALCPRVIVIDKGELLYDGQLKELVRRIRPDKRLTIRFSTEIAPDVLARMGHVVSQTPLQAVLQVPMARVSDVMRDLLGSLPVGDLTVEDPPLDEVMRDLFAAKKVAP